MPRARLPKLNSITDGSFEPNRKNPILLGDDDVLDNHLKVLKIGGINTMLSLSEDELKIGGNLFLGGKLTSNLLECDSDYLTIKPNQYTRFTSTDFSGHLDLYVTSGHAYWLPSGNTSYVINNGKGTHNFGTLSQISMFSMSLTGATFTIEEDGDAENFLQLSVYEHGAAKIKTHDEDSRDAHMTFETDGTTFFISRTAGNTGLFSFSYNEATLINNLYIEVDATGVAAIGTEDSDGNVGHLTLEPNGDLVLDPDSQKTIINATDKLYFDGGTHTYILETSDDQLDFYVGGDNVLRLEEGVANSVNAQSADITIDATYKLFFDGTSAGHTYIAESSDDVIAVVVGSDTMMQLSEKGDDGNEVSFGSSCVGFTQLEPTFDGTNTYVDFRLSNKQFLTFGAASITNLNVRFPLVSGNFVLLIKQDGTGSRTITNYKVREFDESLADGESSVKFAGGSNPTLTTDANHVDILSFYWDADNEIAYGVATLDFQF